MIVTWTKANACLSMDESLLVELGDVVRRHPWWRARARMVLALLRSRKCHPPASVLDAGCGWGVTLESLERTGYAVTGLDISRGALQCIDNPNRHLVEADLSQEWEDAKGSFDAVLALDVIEHLDDDRAALARLSRLVSERGCLIVSVPALPALWSDFDEVQGHRRRYDPNSLHRTFQRSGLTIERMLWWGAWMVPLLRRQRRRGRQRAGQTNVETYRQYLSLPAWPARRGIELAFAIEQPLALMGWLRTGTSLFCVARRSGNA